jgi:hypothetical protein
MEGSDKDGDNVSKDVVWDALQKTLERGVFMGDTAAPKPKTVNGNKYCLRPFVRRGNDKLKTEATNCQCVHTLTTSLFGDQQGPLGKQLTELSRWFSEVRRKATSRGGSWAIASTYIRECSVMGGGGTERSKMIMVNLGKDGDAGLGSTSSGMCLYSLWCAIRIVFWDTQDHGGLALGGAEEFKIAYLHVFAEKIKGDSAKMINRKLLSVYADHTIRGTAEAVEAVVNLDTFWVGVSEEMEEWRKTMGIQRKDWEQYFKNNGLGRIVVCVPLGFPDERMDHRTKGIRKFVDQFPTGARPRLVKLGHDSCLEQVMRWYRYGIHEKNWRPDQMKSARETNRLLKYAGSNGGLLNGLMGDRENSNKTYVPHGHWATPEGKEDLKKTAIADRCLQYAIDTAIQGEGRYDENTGEVAGCEEYLIELKRQWTAREAETGRAPTADWASREFGGRSEDTYTCDVGYLFTKNNHTVQKPHVDYGRRKQMMTNWIGFVPLTRTGMFIEVWPGRPSRTATLDEVTKVDKRLQGSIVYVPYGVALLVRGDTVHAGGMHCDSLNNPYGNPRLHIYIKNKAVDVTSATNGNRWRDYESDNVSDDDTPQQRAVRAYRMFSDTRRDPDCLGFIDGDNQAKNQRRAVSLSTILFSEMLPTEQKTLTKTGWAAKHQGGSAEKSNVARAEQLSATKRERGGGAKIEEVEPEVETEVGGGDRKPAAKRSRKKVEQAGEQDGGAGIEEAEPEVAEAERTPTTRRSPRNKAEEP